MGVVRHLIDKKTLKILDLLLKSKNKYFHLSEISKHSKIPITSTFRIIKQLVSIGIIEITIIGKMKIYRISSNNKTKELTHILNGQLKRKIKKK